MKITSQWIDGRCFVATNETGQSVVMDGAAAESGSKRGASPMEVLLMAAAGCSSIDVVEITRKQRQRVCDCITVVEAERANELPRVFTKIHIHFKVIGFDLNEATIAKAVQLSAEKYCSVSIMLGQAAEISHSFEVQHIEEG